MPNYNLRELLHKLDNRSPEERERQLVEYAAIKRKVKYEALCKDCYEKDKDDVLNPYNYYVGFVSGCDAMLDKACEWIKYHNENGGCLFDNWEESFRKAMEE